MKLLPTHRYSRFVVSVGLIAALSPISLRAQNAAAADSGVAANSKDQVVQLSAFEIRTTRDQGYILGNSASAMKTAQPLLDIPQSVLVVTNDMINDIGMQNTSDTLAFVGINHSFQGNTSAIRGGQDGYPYIDGMPDHGEFEDDIYIDSYEIIEGPAEVLYSGAPLSGVVLKTTKKPLPKQQDILSITMTQFGGYRAWLDSTGPIGKIGESKFSYRFVGLIAGGHQYFDNQKGDRKVLHPTLEWDYRQVTAIVAYDFQKFETMAGGQTFLLPNGKPYAGPGWGRDNMGFPRNSSENNWHHGGRVYLIDRFSDSWQMQFSARYMQQLRYGTGIFPVTMDLHSNTETWFARQENLPFDYWVVQGDFIGKYAIGPVQNQSSFGFNDSDLQSKLIIWTTSAYTNQTVPLTKAGTDSLVVPKIQNGQFPVPASPGTRSTNTPANIYYQHQVDVIPNWLSLVGGYTYSHIETVADSNIAKSTPYTATDTSATEWLHRFGAVLHVTKQASLYALESESYSPQSKYNDINGRPLPNTLGKSDEVGFKTSLFNGRLSSSLAIYKMTLTNQAVVSNVPGPNGIAYFVPIGSTTSKGWDGNLSLQITPQWQLIATGYNGRVLNSSNQLVAFTYLNAWSVFTRYDFEKRGPLSGLSIGGGANRIGGVQNPLGGLILADGSSPSYTVKQWAGTPIDLFAVYSLNKHWEVRLNGNNLLNQNYIVGNGGGEGALDESLPINFSFTLTYKF